MALRIVFFGTAEIACPSLEALARDPQFQLVAVVTQREEPAFPLGVGAFGQAVVDDPERSLVVRQVEMGVAVRMAVLDALLPAGSGGEQ